MASSGTYTFNLDIPDLVDNAYELAGIEGARTGYQLKQARRYLDLILQDWQNDQVNLWTLELDTQTLTTADVDYTLDAETQDVMDVYLRRSSRDYPLERLSLFEYNDYVNKASSGMPRFYVIVRETSSVRILLYPAPENSTDVLYFYRIRNLQDISTYTNNADIPRRFLPALAWGLAYYIAFGKIKDEVSLLKCDKTKATYEQVYMRAREEDRERADVPMKPGLRNYGNR